MQHPFSFDKTVRQSEILYSQCYSAEEDITNHYLLWYSLLIISMLDTITIGEGALIGFLVGVGIASARELSPTFLKVESTHCFSLAQATIFYL